MTLRYVKRGDVILSDDHNAVRQAFIDLCDTVKAKAPGAPDVQAKCDEIKMKVELVIRIVRTEDFVLASDHNAKREILRIEIPALWELVSAYQAEFVDKRQELIDKASLISERKYGDFVLAEDHNSVISALELARTQAEQVNVPVPVLKHVICTGYLVDRFNLINVEDKTSPWLEGTLYDTRFDGPHYARKIDLDNACLSGLLSDYFCTIDMTDKANPSVKGAVTATSLDGATATVIKDNYAYVIGRYARVLNKVDIANLTAPSVVASVTLTRTLPISLALKDNYAIITHHDGVTGLSVVDITTMTEVASPDPTATGLQGILIDGDYAYVTDQTTDAVYVLDVSDPIAPSLLDSVTSTQLDGALCFHPAKKDNYLFVPARIADSFVVIDVSDPTNISQVAYITDPRLDGARDVRCHGDYAYVACWDADALTIIDVSNPLSPSIVASLSVAELDGAVCVGLVI